MDIDDTIIRNGIVDTKLINLMNLYKSKGHRIIIATGRSLNESKDIISLFKEVDAAIVLQGAQTYAGNKLLYHDPIDKGICLDILSYCQKKNLATEIYYKNTKISLKKEYEVITEDIYNIKIHFYKIKKIKKEFIRLFGNNQNIMMRTHNDNIVIHSINTDKGKALSKFCKYINEKSVDFIGIGNFPSDSTIFDETLLNIVLNKSYEKNDMGILQYYTVSKTVDILKEIVEKAEIFKINYIKNQKVSIRKFKDEFYVINGGEIKKVEELDYILYKNYIDSNSHWDTVKILLNFYNFSEISESLKKLEKIECILEE
ncbi:HAD family phosphatase [Staphylococcus ursi]|uniref:HAD hydrolase family protein n=1 Tax=Staphylococcus sp. MI 10-1553 TaxID=1912064 RepID=UPI001397CF42|nr:HAD hydrolase family protein [Staphylococcus sp. MI 10-1553]QHW35913.1 HAD family phosphatase [Staphylococcus sp. MI 10-1553]